MKFATKITGRCIVICLCLSLLFPLCVSPIRAQNKSDEPQKRKRAIVVNAEQPNVWTLEQAHYLLAQMHRRNLDLKATGLGELDPNEINGLNFDVLRTLVEFGATFDDAARFNNSLLKTRKSFDADRALRLQNRRDQLADESLALNRDIARLGRERALATSQEEKDTLSAQIAELTAVRDGNDKEVARIDNDLKTAGGPTGDVQATDAQPNFDPNKLPKSTFDDSFKEVTKMLIDRFNQSPKLNATLRLDNFIQMQYEIIAKQLTLLRDEVGPGQRIIFLELPQTVNATYDKANNKWAQSWWKIVGYTAPVPSLSIGDWKGAEGEAGTETVARFTVTLSPASPKTTEVQYSTGNNITTKGQALAGVDYIPKSGTLVFPPGITRKNVYVTINGDREMEQDEKFSIRLINPKMATIADAEGEGTIEDDDTPAPQQTPTPTPEASNARSLQYKLQTVENFEMAGQPTVLKEDAGGKLYVDESEETGRTTQQIIYEAINAVNQDRDTEQVFFVKQDSNRNVQPGVIAPEDPSVRTIELIPRQSSLNVNDIKLRARAGVLTAVAKTLFGFGARLNVQRQRETFSQFVQQELYSSGFGKGSREFGWTYTPMPGMDRVLSGARTTYAVLVVPAEAETLVLQSTGCYFPRSEYQPNNFSNTGDPRWTESDRQSRNCAEHKSFIVPIPGGGLSNSNDFWVNGLEYAPVKKGERVVLSIYGKNFSSQIGVMVDGIPLKQAIGLAQPFIRDDSLVGVAAAQDLKDTNIQGRVERVDANQIVAVFERLDGKDGTPVITLTSPGKSKSLNNLVLRINGTPNTTLAASPFMFGKKTGEKDKFRIDKLEVFRSRNSGNLTAVISGDGFVNGQSAFVNGSPLVTQVVSPKLITTEFPVPSDETIRVTLVSPTDDPPTIESDAVPNPARLMVNNVSVVSYEAATDEEPTATLVVKIEGSGFTDDLRAFIGEKAIEIAVKSATEAILKITDPEAAAVVILKDDKTGLQTKFIVTRKSQPPK